MAEAIEPIVQDLLGPLTEAIPVNRETETTDSMVARPALDHLARTTETTDLLLGEIHETADDPTSTIEAEIVHVLTESVAGIDPMAATAGKVAANSMIAETVKGKIEAATAHTVAMVVKAEAISTIAETIEGRIEVGTDHTAETAGRAVATPTTEATIAVDTDARTIEDRAEALTTTKTGAEVTVRVDVKIIEMAGAPADMNHAAAMIGTPTDPTSLETIDTRTMSA